MASAELYFYFEMCRPGDRFEATKEEILELYPNAEGYLRPGGNITQFNPDGTIRRTVSIMGFTRDGERFALNCLPWDD
jgi:hypothetical protein